MIDATFSGDEQEELAFYRRIYKKERILESIRSLSHVGDDIDEPVKTALMGLALLGCDPLWSCCGFDYMGQPIHKSHQYNYTWFVLNDSPTARWLHTEWLGNPPSIKDSYNYWKMWGHRQFGNIHWTLSADLKRGNTWPDENDPHFSEPGVIAIAQLENWLEKYIYAMADEVVLHSANEEYRREFPHWQYPILPNWTVTKDEFASRLNRGATWK